MDNTLILTGYHEKERDFGLDFSVYFKAHAPYKGIHLHHCINSSSKRTDCPDNSELRFNELYNKYMEIKPAKIIDIHNGYTTGNNHDIFFQAHSKQYDASGVEYFRKKAMRLSDFENDRRRLIGKFNINYFLVEALISSGKNNHFIKDDKYISLLEKVSGLVLDLHKI